VEGFQPGDVRAETGDPRTLVSMLVLGEVLTPRRDLGPLARFWVPAGPRRAATEAPRRADPAER
jgi:hypothetical protein